MAEEESLFVTYIEKPGSFVGQLEKLSSKDLAAITNELKEVYSGEMTPPLLYADVKSHLGHFAVYQWNEDNNYYRVMILDELGNDVKVLLIDFGNVIQTPRSTILAPTENLTSFRQPRFAIHCKFDDADHLQLIEWEDILIDKSIQVKLRNCVDGIYSVSLTSSPSNKDIINFLASKTLPKINALEHTG